MSPVVFALLALGDLAAVDVARFDPARSGAEIRRDGSTLSLVWPCGDDGRKAAVEFDLASGRDSDRAANPRRMIKSIRVTKGGALAPIVVDVDPVVFVTVGTRENPPGRPPEMSLFNVFFDTPASRPHETHVGLTELKNVTVASEGVRTVVTLGDLVAGPFRGVWTITVFRGSPLIQVQAVVTTEREKTAFYYDLGLKGSNALAPRVAWTDVEGRFRKRIADAKAPIESVPVRHRILSAETDTGSLAVFPPPHRFFFPRDRTDNLRHVWFGRGFHESKDGWGLGIRQEKLGGGAYVPWFNAPPGSVQHLGLYLIPSPDSAEKVAAEALAFTRGDRYADVPGYTTFTSHWHMAITVDAMNRRDKNLIPDWVRMFKEMNVRIAHLGEFHGDGHPGDPGPLRLAEMAAMFKECERLSDDRLLVLPGEEANAHFGLKHPGRHPGHYMLLFPKPVTWIMKRAEGEPFASADPRYGKVYRVGGLEEMQKLVEAEGGLAWTAHPRIKASNWTPDAFMGEPFYKADTWLGAAWKAMPADLSRERLGDRCLDLLSDMANHGDRKYMPGEVDVFKVDHTHELFGHMNINYLKLDKPPTYAEGWKPVLDALRGGKFWVTTGEVLLRDWTIDGKESGETLKAGDGIARVKGTAEWTFPPAFLEVVSGDGAKVYRHRVALDDQSAHGSRAFDFDLNLKGRKWARIEVWDVAGNGAFTQPFWIEP